FAGTYGALGGAVLGINPWDIRGTANAIHEAINMTDDDKQYRWEHLYRQVTSITARNFVKTFLKQVEEARLMAEDRGYGVAADLPRLNVTRELPFYNHSHKRLLFLEYEGVLVPHSAPTDHPDAHRRAHELIKALASDSRNTVCILSNRSRSELEVLFGDIAGLGIAAENACFVKRCTSTQWEPLIALEDLSWKDSVQEIFEFYTDRIPGSRIDKKDIRITWDYSQADNQEFGRRQALECQSHINESLGNTYPIRAIALDQTVEVIPRAADRGAFVYYAIEHPSSVEASSGHLIDPFDFILYFGTGRCEEDIFTVLKRLSSSVAERMSQSSSTQSVVSSSPSPSSPPADAKQQQQQQQQSISSPAALPINYEGNGRGGNISGKASGRKHRASCSSVASSTRSCSSSAVSAHSTLRPFWETITMTHIDPKFHLVTASVSTHSADAQFFLPTPDNALDALATFVKLGAAGDNEEGGSDGNTLVVP
ncbi:Trehalose-6-P synthase/phosphatase complex subunit, partial [Spiromyces aspiralis]